MAYLIIDNVSRLNPFYNSLFFTHSRLGLGCIMFFIMEQGKHYLITTDGWFYAPDGLKYRAVWGRVEIKNDKSTLGISTNAKSTNWYAVVGSGDKSMIVAGCQIHYAVRCENPPNFKDVEEIVYGGSEPPSITKRPTEIYSAE